METDTGNRIYRNNSRNNVNTNTNSQFSKRNNNPRYIFKKRPVAKGTNSTGKDTDIYISNSSNFTSLIERIEKLWVDGRQEVTLHALGGCIPRAVNLALQLQEKHYDTYDLHVTTDSVNIVDDLLPATDEDDFETQSRWSSSINIRLFRKLKEHQQE